MQAMSSGYSEGGDTQQLDDVFHVERFAGCKGYSKQGTCRNAGIRSTAFYVCWS